MIVFDFVITSGKVFLATRSKCNLRISSNAIPTCFVWEYSSISVMPVTEFRNICKRIQILVSILYYLFFLYFLCIREKGEKIYLFEILREYRFSSCRILLYFRKKAIFVLLQEWFVFMYFSNVNVTYIFIFLIFYYYLLLFLPFPFKLYF